MEISSNDEQKCVNLVRNGSVCNSPFSISLHSDASVIPFVQSFFVIILATGIICCSSFWAVLKLSLSPLSYIIQFESSINTFPPCNLCVQFKDHGSKESSAGWLKSIIRAAYIAITHCTALISKYKIRKSNKRSVAVMADLGTRSGSFAFRAFSKLQQHHSCRRRSAFRIRVPIANVKVSLSILKVQSHDSPRCVKNFILVAVISFTQCSIALRDVSPFPY